MKKIETPKKVGVWWNEKNIEIYKIDNRNIALYGWNGDRYLHCFEVNEKLDKILKDEIEVLPIYDDLKIIDYIIVGE